MLRPICNFLVLSLAIGPFNAKPSNLIAIEYGSSIMNQQNMEDKKIISTLRVYHDETKAPKTLPTWKELPEKMEFPTKSQFLTSGEVNQSRQKREGLQRDPVSAFKFFMKKLPKMATKALHIATKGPVNYGYPPDIARLLADGKLSVTFENKKIIITAGNPKNST